MWFSHLTQILVPCKKILQCSDKLGLSLELGSFVAGVMLSTTEFAQHTLEQVGTDNKFYVNMHCEYTQGH